MLPPLYSNLTAARRYGTGAICFQLDYRYCAVGAQELPTLLTLIQHPDARKLTAQEVDDICFEERVSLYEFTDSDGDHTPEVDEQARERASWSLY